jgi:hypothetical protein
MKVNVDKYRRNGTLAKNASDIVLWGGKIAGPGEAELHFWPRQPAGQGRKSILTNTNIMPPRRDSFHHENRQST